MFLTTRQLDDFKKVCEQYDHVEEVIEEELIHEICDELVEELVTEGYSEIDAILIVEDAANDYIDEAKVTFGHDTKATRSSGAPVGARRRFAMRKAGGAVKAGGSAVKGAMAKAKSKAAGAAVDASLAYDAAKKKAGEVKKAVSDAPTKVARAAARGTEKVEKKVKSGIKGMIGRAAKKVASKAAGVAKRMSEEIEALKSSGKFSDKEIEAFIAIDENRRAARAAGGYKDDSKKQPDPSKDGFTGIGNMSIDQIRKMSARIEKEKKK